MLRVKNLTKKYSTGRGIEGVSFTVNPGEILVLLGPNGSGKSTILRCIANVLDYSGSVELLGKPAKSVKEKIAYLPENSPLVEKFTALENLLFYAWAYGMEIDKARQRALELLKLFNLSAYANSLVESFSYGMRRKLAIAQTLLPQAKLVLLDEPSLGLDHNSKLTLYKYLKEYAAEGRGIIIATNDVVEAQELAHTVCFVHEGRVVEIAEPSQLLAELGERVKIKIKFKKPPEKLSFGNLVNGSVEVVERSSSVLPDIIQEIISEGGIIENISIKEPDLGDVFLRKTGRWLK